MRSLRCQFDVFASWNNTPGLRGGSCARRVNRQTPQSRKVDCVLRQTQKLWRVRSVHVKGDLICIPCLHRRVMFARPYKPPAHHLFSCFSCLVAESQRIFSTSQPPSPLACSVLEFGGSIHRGTHATHSEHDKIRYREHELRKTCITDTTVPLLHWTQVACVGSLCICIFFQVQILMIQLWDPLEVSHNPPFESVNWKITRPWPAKSRRAQASACSLQSVAVRLKCAVQEGIRRYDFHPQFHTWATSHGS